jgi:predicted alpha/beta hydrolase family esterase
MQTEKYITYSVIFLVVIYCAYCMIVHINGSMLFIPDNVSKQDYINFCEKHKDNYIPYNFKADDGIELSGGLYNYKKSPEWSDQIFFYSHGNAGWLGTVYNSPIVKTLCNYGSVFIYDYRGYGITNGNPSDTGLEYDVIGAWNFVKQYVEPEKIIVAGHSLGSGVSCKLMAHLNKTQQVLPKHLILNAPFSSVKDMARHVLPALSHFTIYEFDNMKNIQHINKKVNISILHSKDDEIIPFSQAVELSNSVDCKFFEIHGEHNNAKYTPDALEYLKYISE